MTPAIEGQSHDQELIERIQLGDQAAVVEVYQQHRERVTRALRARFGGLPDDEIDDLYHDAFIRFLGRAHDLDPRRHHILGGYLTTTAINRRLDLVTSQEQQRRQPARPSGEGHEERDPLESVADQEVAPLDGLVSVEERTRIVRALDNLGWKPREALEMRYFDNLDLPAIQQRLGLTYPATKALLDRGRRSLYTILKADGQGEVPLALGGRHFGRHSAERTAFEKLPADVVRAQLDQLSPLQHTVVERHYLQGQLYVQIAASLSVRPTTVRNAAALGRRRILALLSEQPLPITASRRPARRNRVAGTPLTRSEYCCLRYLALGLSYGVIAELAGWRGPQAARGFVVSARKRLGLTSGEAAVDWMRRHLRQTGQGASALIDTDRAPVNVPAAVAAGDSLALASEIELLRMLLKGYLYASQGNAERLALFKMVLFRRTRIALGLETWRVIPFGATDGRHPNLAEEKQVSHAD